MEDAKQPLHTVNKRLPRIDAYEKVTGRLRFGADLKYPGMLYGKQLHAAYPHARILSLDTAAAEALSGVAAVVTAADIPGQPTIGGIVQDQYVLAGDKTRYHGDVVAVVAAEDAETAEQAVRLIKVEYEPLPVIDGIEAALACRGEPVHGASPDNVTPDSAKIVRKGDIAAGFAEADLILERDYSTQFVEHAYIEPEAVVAVPGPRERQITVNGSIQAPFNVRRSLSRVLNIPQNKATVIQQAIGGTFGGKLDTMEVLAVRAALLALKSGRPVRLVQEREESIRESHKRHPFKMHYKVGAKQDGRVTAMQVSILSDAGAYTSMTPSVNARGVVQGCGPYHIPNVWMDAKGLYTNNPYTGSMRGFGSPQVVFGVESLMTELAGELGISPYEIRRINALRTNDRSTTDQLLDKHTVSVQEVMDKAAAALDFHNKWQEYNQPQTGNKRRGVGLALSMRGVSLGPEGLDVGRAVIQVVEDGSVVVSTGLTEQGQGLRTVLSQIAAEALGVGVERIYYPDTDTCRCPDSGPTEASRGTTMGGGACQDAGLKLNRIICEAVAKEYGVAADQVTLANEVVGWPGGRMSFDRAVRLCAERGVTLMVVGEYIAPEIVWHEEGYGEAYFTYVYACQAAEVEVDLGTGKVGVIRAAAAHDVGRAVNPGNVEGQICGGFAMAAGFALLEDLGLEGAVARHANFDEYLIPTSLDVGDITALIVENPDAAGPYGAKCIGEAATELGAPAIVSAIAQATGRRVRDLPASLEKVLLGHELSRTAKRGSAQ